VKRCLIVDNNCGISGKDANAIIIHVDQSTIIAKVEYALGALNKTGGMFPTVSYHVTNSILWSLNPNTNAVFTSYNPADIKLSYCAVGNTNGWAGATNSFFGDPRLMSMTNHDYRLQAYSPAIDAGDPAAPRDPDGSPADMGYFRFVPPPPMLAAPAMSADGFAWQLHAYSNRNYVISVATNAVAWSDLATVFCPAETTVIRDGSATNAPLRFYRARLAP
jgi:hypothetical protein